MRSIRVGTITRQPLSASLRRDLRFRRNSRDEAHELFGRLAGVGDHDHAGDAQVIAGLQQQALAGHVAKGRPADREDVEASRPRPAGRAGQSCPQAEGRQTAPADRARRGYVPAACGWARPRRCKPPGTKSLASSAVFAWPWIPRSVKVRIGQRPRPGRLRGLRSWSGAACRAREKERESRPARPRATWETDREGREGR